MKKPVLIGVIVAAVLLVAGAAGGGMWWWQSRHGGAAAAAPPPPKPSPYRYVTLDKVIVMLRSQAGEPLAHYMAVDLVFKAEGPEKEKAVKDQLPLLRSVAVQALSSYTLDKASALTVEELTKEMGTAYAARYSADHIEQPFAEVLVGKLIIE